MKDNKTIREEEWQNRIDCPKWIFKLSNKRFAEIGRFIEALTKDN